VQPGAEALPRVPSATRLVLKLALPPGAAKPELRSAAVRLPDGLRLVSPTQFAPTPAPI
jgi:hypothetical protein